MNYQLYTYQWICDECKKGIVTTAQSLIRSTPEGWMTQHVPVEYGYHEINLCPKCAKKKKDK